MQEKETHRNPFQNYPTGVEYKAEIKKKENSPLK